MRKIIAVGFSQRYNRQDVAGFSLKTACLCWAKAQFHHLIYPLAEANGNEKINHFYTASYKSSSHYKPIITPFIKPSHYETPFTHFLFDRRWPLLNRYFLHEKAHSCRYKETR
jgi:hypothetical protein